jgi:hypothetical protein
MKRGKEGGDSKKPSWRWKDRFHRSNPPFRLGIAAYVSRPTFDLLRSSSKEGKCVYHAIIEFLKYSVGELKQPLRGKQWSDDDEKLHSFSFKMGVKGKQSLIILLVPFNVQNEMDICKQGFMLHAIPIIKEYLVEEVDLDKPLLQDIFTQGEHFESHFQLDTVINKDMREIVEPAFENVVSKEQFTNMSKDSMDFAAARLLPTDLYLELEKKGGPPSHVMAKTREFLSRQFNEVRLLDDITKANLEQIQAIDMYRHSKSSAINISGRPGVGKSTILHIDACEALLQRGELRGERKLLYLAATTELVEEAKGEILDLLKYLYFWNSKNPEEDAKNIFKNIDFAVEEDFFLREPGSLGPLTDFELFKQQVQRTQDDPSWSFWKKEKNLRYLQRILQNFVYGVFGSPSDFCNWIPRGSIKKLEERFTQPFNFYNPERRFIPDESDDLSSDFFATYFWDPGFNDEQIGEKEAAKRVNGLANFISKGGLGDYLVDYSINKYTGMYDVGSVVHKTAKKLFADKKSPRHHESIQENRLWSQILERGYDVILVDESQDFSALSISTMLQYFSNRGVHRDSNHAPFSFVCAGDEFQTIHGTLFQGAMIHINKIYTDWKMLLREQSEDDFNLLSNDLPNPIKLVLRASYRTSDLQTEILDNVVKMMRGIAFKAGHRRSVSISTYGIRRNGVIAGLPEAGSPENENLHNWVQVMQELLNQIKEIGGPDAAPKVAFIFPVTEIKSFDQIMKQLEDFRSMELHNGVLDIIKEIELEIKRQYKINKNKYSRSESFDDDLNFISMMKEAGFCDIRGIKGLTVPVAVTLMPPVKIEKNKRWFENMRTLSLSLVMISRSQFGLFVAAPEDIVKLTIGDELWSMVSNEDIAKGLMHSSLPDNDNFADRLANSSPSEISPKLLFKIAVNEWYIERGWSRLHESALLEHDHREVVDKLRKIYIGIRANGISAYDEIEDLSDFRERAKSAESTFGTLDYFSEEAGEQLQWFLLWQDLCRKSSEGASKSVKKNLIKRIQIFCKKMWGTVVDGNNFSRDFISSLVSNDVAAKIEQLDHPWNKKFQNIPTLNTQELDIVPPRFYTGPWKLTAPPNIPVEESILWHQKSNYWAPPANVLREVLKESTSEHAALMNWVIDWIELDVEIIMRNALSSFKRGDLSYLAWVLRLVFSDEEDSPNHGQYLHGEILNYLAQEIPKNKLLCEGLTAWLEQTGSTEKIEDGCTFIKNLYRGKERSTRRERNRVLSEYIDGLSVFKSWLYHANKKKKSALEIPNIILKLSKGRLEDILTKLQKLNSFNGRRGGEGEFLKSAFSIKIDTLQEIESQNKIENDALQTLVHRVYERVLTDNTPSNGVLVMGDDREGTMFNAGLLINPHYHAGSLDINYVEESGRDLFNKSNKKVMKNKNLCSKGPGGHATLYYEETDTFHCSKCEYSIPMDDGYLWYKSMADVIHNAEKSSVFSSGFLANFVIDQFKDSYDKNMLKITTKIREGRVRYDRLTDHSKEALCIGLAENFVGTRIWRPKGHIGDWVKNELGEITTERFDSMQSVLKIGTNNQTFDAYDSLHCHEWTEWYTNEDGVFVTKRMNPIWRDGIYDAMSDEEFKEHDSKHKDFIEVKAHEPMRIAINAFVESGAIAEAQALFIANFPPGKTDGEFLQHFSQSLHLEGLVYQEHVSAKKRFNSIVPVNGKYTLHKPLEELYGDLTILPSSIYAKMKKGFAKNLVFVGEKNKGSDETKFHSLYNDWIIPYIKRMNSYLAISHGAKMLEEIGRKQDGIDIPGFKAKLDAGALPLNAACFSKNAFKSMGQLRQLGGTNSDLTDRGAFDWYDSVGVVDVNIRADFKIKCNVFTKLLSKYRAIQSIKIEEGLHSDTREIVFTWWGDVFSILEAKGIKALLESCFVGLGGWGSEQDVINNAGFHNQYFADGTDLHGEYLEDGIETEDGDVYSAEKWNEMNNKLIVTEMLVGRTSTFNERKLLEHHLREKYGLTDKMITMFLDEVERGKPELDRMLDESNEQIWGAYQTLLHHSNEE